MTMISNFFSKEDTWDRKMTRNYGKSNEFPVIKVVSFDVCPHRGKICLRGETTEEFKSIKLHLENFAVLHPIEGTSFHE